MHGHNAALAALANKDRRHRTIDGTRGMNAPGEPPSRADWIPWVSVENRRGIKPAAAGGVEKPSPIVVRGPAPRLIAEPGPAKSGIHDPLPICEWGPAEAHAKRPPTVSIGPTRGKGAIGIQIGETRGVVRRTCVLQCRCCGGGDAVDAAGNPAIEVIFIRKAGDIHGRIV